jgi:hypothetical protein
VKTCQWIEGPVERGREPNFCNKPVWKPGQSWCACHHQVVFSKDYYAYLYQLKLDKLDNA